MDIMKRLQEHWEEAKKIYPEDRMCALLLQGSQNYDLNYEHSDVDTKLVILPSLEDIVFNRKPVSTTHILDNDEHIDAKDIRLMMGCFKKQNLNFVEVLFTKYKIINPLYETEWNRLVKNNELIARYDPYAAVKTMKGMAMEKYYALEHPYPSKMELIDKDGYDGKQLSHMLRIYEFLNYYIADLPYDTCLHPWSYREVIMKAKRNEFTLEETRQIAETYNNKIVAIADNFCKTHPKNPNPEVEKLLNEVQANIMRIGLRKELENND